MNPQEVFARLVLDMAYFGIKLVLASILFFALMILSHRSAERWLHEKHSEMSLLESLLYRLATTLAVIAITLMAK